MTSHDASEQRAQQYIMKQAFSQQELHEREAVCTRNEPPACTASCPLHVDLRSLCSHVAEGDFSKALATIRMVTPFVHLIAKTCDAPCAVECVCPGESVNIHRIIQACIRYGTELSKRKLFLPKKTKRIAVVGVGAFALAAARELGVKGYKVSLFGTEESPVDVLKNYGLSDEEASFDLSEYPSLSLTYYRQQEFDSPFFEELLQSFDALCVESHLISLDQRDEIRNSEREEYESEKVFYSKQDNPGMSFTLASAKSTAITIDRYLQGVKSNEGRDREGPFKSELYVSYYGTEPTKRVLGDSEPLSEEAAKAEAARCIQCSCTECMRGCAFLQHYGRDPRRMIREIYNNLSIVMGNHTANGMINSCALCEQCSVLCPNGFEMAEVCQLARNTMVETGKMPPSTHEFALLDLEFSNSKAHLSKAQPGFIHCDYLFFPGCQLSSVTPELVERIWIDLSKRLQGGVGLSLGCCGAIARWAGREELFKTVIDELREEWKELGSPTIITACPNCKRFLSEDSDAEVVDIWSVFTNIGAPQTVKLKDSEVVGLHDPCGARGDTMTQNSVRALLKEIGYEVKESLYSRDSSPCCGYGGLVSYANKELAQEMAEFCSAQTDDPLLTYCMACRDRFIRNGRDNRHVLELLYGLEPLTSPDISMRRYNRYALKNKILKEVFLETVNEEGYDFTIDISPEVATTLDDRMILVSDVYQVLDEARKTGSVIKDLEKGILLSYRRLGNVTFWIRYIETDENKYKLLGAYSLRMTVEAKQ